MVKKPLQTTLDAQVEDGRTCNELQNSNTHVGYKITSGKRKMSWKFNGSKMV